MGPFLSFARRLLQYPGQLALALFFAAISAAGLGAGLLGLAPILNMILGKNGTALPELATQFNQGKPFVAIPEFLIGWLPEGRFEGVLLVLGGLALLTVLGAAANFLHQYFSIQLCAKVIARIRLDAFRHAIRMPLGEVVRLGPAEFASRVIRDTAELQGGLLALTSKTVAQLTKGIAAFIVAIVIDWRIVVVAAIAGPLLGIILRKSGKRIRRGAKGALKHQATLLRVTGESLQGLRAVKTSTAEKSMLGRFRRANSLVVSEQLRARTAQSLASPLIETLTILVVIVLAAFAVREILRGSLTFDEFLLSLGALAVAAGCVRPLAGLAAEMQAASAPAERLRELLSIEAEPTSTRSRPNLLRHQHWIRFEGLSFRYPNAEVLALNEINLEIRHGEHIAIVGPNGCGKTTLLSMIPRLLTPKTGRVLIDGADISQVNLKSLRRQIGVVTQESVLIQGTIAQNIALGMASATDSQIQEAARRAHADSFIQAIPGAYSADVAEQGASLSGGQRQRISIARAVLRDPSILILDEATSQIDAESEAQISQAIAEFGCERTVIAIAHRLSTMLAADRIIVMDRGRIIDSGTHTELLTRCDVYARLAKAQMQSADDSMPEIISQQI